MSDDPYATLGVPRDADEAAIKAAHKRRVQKAHPDKGGTAEEFNHVQAAYELLADPARRKRFDEVGQTGALQDPLVSARIVVAKMVSKIILDLPDVDHHDLVAIMQTSTRAELGTLQKKIRDSQAVMARCENAKRRFTHKGLPADDIVAQVLDDGVRKMLEAIARLEDDVAAYNRVLEVLEQYTYAADSQIWPGGVSMSLGAMQQQMMGGTQQ